MDAADADAQKKAHHREVFWELNTVGKRSGGMGRTREGSRRGFEMFHAGGNDQQSQTNEQ